MTYTYSITLGHHFQNAWGIVIFIVGYSLLPFYQVYRFGDKDLPIYLIGSLILFLLFFIPQLIVHLRYYWLDKGKTFSYTPNKQWLVLKHKDGGTFEFSLDEILLIERSKTIPFAEERMLWMPWDSYNYSIIRLKNGQQFVITSLLVPNLDLPLESEKVKLRKRFYCYPFGAKENLNPHDD